MKRGIWKRVEENCDRGDRRKMSVKKDVETETENLRQPCIPGTKRRKTNGDRALVGAGGGVEQENLMS